jgi:mRNA-degrading endonuclease RelE of RelBE toxin-antitoxin system
LTKFEVLLSETAHKQLVEMGEKDEARMRQALKQVAAQPYRRRSGADIKKLVGTDPAMYRLRVGDWRALFFIVGTEVRVTSIRRRENAYD